MPGVIITVMTIPENKHTRLSITGIVFVLSLLLIQCFQAEAQKDAATTNHSVPRGNLVPLPLRLPAPPSGSWPESFEEGPNIEPYYASKKLRPLFLVPEGVSNLARGMKVSSSATKSDAALSQITDGQKEARDEQMAEIRRGVQWVQIDLGRECNIYAVVIWHDFRDPFLITRNVVVQLADDPEFTNNVRTLFNNDREDLTGRGAGTDKQYFESLQGRLIDAKGMTARFVRCYSNGSNRTPLNCYTEIEVWGLPSANGIWTNYEPRSSWAR